MKTFIQKSATLIAITLCLFMLDPLLPMAAAQNNSKITVSVGQPNIWSLGQAHYLLSNMRERSRALGVKVPVPEDLDPSSANGNRMNMLRTLIGADVGIDKVSGLQNSMLEQRFDADLAQFTLNQARLDTLNTSYADAVREVSSLTVQLAAIPDKQEFADQRKEIQTQLAARTGERDSLKAQIDGLLKPLTAPTPPTTFKGTFPTSGPSPLPDDLKDMFTKMNSTVATPKLNASTTLENYVQMQYEVIAKQLTLLRDEVGPSQRLVFLELPMSLYSVPKRDDDYVIRLEWEINRLYRPTVGPCTVTTVNADAAESAKRTETQTKAQAEKARRAEQKARGIVTQNEPVTIETIRQHPEGIPIQDPVDDKDHLCWSNADKTTFRVLDVIPRQSALNVNDQNGTQTGWALTARFLTLFGLGGQVNFQRQRSIYEQFIQQDVYASGYGKGMSSFGWTFGPLPGTKRLAPGVRTTYAILAIPKDASAMELKVAAKVYKRDVPLDGSSVKTLQLEDEGFGNGMYQIIVPQEDTEGFWITKTNYTPVEKGKQVTVMLEGKYFSPLTGVLVNGVPLKRAVSLAKNESATANLLTVAAIDPAGEYEYLNPQQMILSFRMPDDYVGTPLITLVTPEKTAAINFLEMKEINSFFTNTSLAAISGEEPMFVDSFRLGNVEFIRDDPTDITYVILYLHGSGFRRGATFLIDGNSLGVGETSKYVSPNLYELRIKRPQDGKAAKILYRNTTRQSIQEDTASFQQTVVSSYEITRYEPARQKHDAQLELILTISGQDAAPVVQIDSGDGNLLQGPTALGNHRFKLKLEAKRDPVPLMVTTITGVSSTFDIGLPEPPSIARVVNTATNKPEGPGGKPAIVTLHGANFLHVARVFFGTKEATILQVDPQVVLVNAPAGDEGPVRILVETNVNLRGKNISNIADFRTQEKAIYTYTK